MCVLFICCDLNLIFGYEKENKRNPPLVVLMEVEQKAENSCEDTEKMQTKNN